MSLELWNNVIYTQVKLTWYHQLNLIWLCVLRYSLVTLELSLPCQLMLMQGHSILLEQIQPSSPGTSTLGIYSRSFFHQSCRRFSTYHISYLVLNIIIFVIQTMEGHKRDILCMVMANRVMYTGSSDVSARCWVREFGECSKLYKGHQNAVICLKFYKGICESCSVFTLII